MSDDTPPKLIEQEPLPTFATFLESYHPSQVVMVKDVWVIGGAHKQFKASINTPSLRLFCTHENCTGSRMFRRTGNEQVIYGGEEDKMLFLNYICSDCRVTTKSFSLHLTFSKSSDGLAYKYGEEPSFGVPIPNKVLRLFEDDKELFFKGRQCENQGMGIAAFAYYRRVVEHQKKNIFAEIIKVSKVLGTSEDMLNDLEREKENFQFSASVDAIKSAIPQVIFINGQNPLTLLHNALSRGLHNDNDADCLALAQSIRLVLTEMVGRLADLKKDDQELARAVSNLVNPKTKLPYHSRIIQAAV